MPSIPPSNYQHDSKNFHLNDLHQAMQYNASGEPEIRVHAGGITLSGDVTVDNVTIDNAADNPVPVTIQNDCLSVQNCEGTTLSVSQGTNPWIISRSSDPNGPDNEIFVKVTNETLSVDIVDSCLSVQNCTGTRLNVNSNSIIVLNELPVGSDNPFPVSIANCVSIQNCGESTLGINGTVGLEYDGQVVNESHPLPVTGSVTTDITGQEIVIGGATKETAFGELYGITITPVIQLDSIYGITSEVIETFINGTGATAGGGTGLFSANSGTSTSGYAAVASKRFLRYRPGQGALARFTAAFSPTVVQTTQRAGLFNRENSIQIGINDDGINGPRFGVHRASGGRVHITVLTINTAPTGNQTVTITLNGVAHTVTGITSGTTTGVAVQIAKVGVFPGWYIDQVDNTIVFSAAQTQPASGTYSFSSAGAGTLTTGTFSVKQAGVTQTEYWTYQENFNLDTLDGTGNAGNPSGMELKSQFLNVFQINFRWLGAGEIRYAIEDDSNGNMIFFHHEHYVNRYNVPHTTNPSFRLGYISANSGSEISATVTGSSMMAAIEGEIKQNELNRSVSVNKTTLAQNVTHHLLTIRNPYVTNGKSGALNGNYVINAKEIILKDISIATQGNDPSILYVFFEPTSFSATHVYSSQPKDNGMTSTVDGTFDPTVDTAICRFVSAINGQASYPLRDFRVTIPPGATVSFAINSTAQISRVTFAVVFSED